MDQLLARAYRAYFRMDGDRADQPAECLSGQESVGDKSYIVLRNSKCILAVYRVCRDDRLKRLRRGAAMLDWDRAVAGGGVT
jgi:hypothetical protein